MNFSSIKMHKYTHTDPSTLKGYRGPKTQKIKAQVHGASVGPKGLLQFQTQNCKKHLQIQLLVTLIFFFFFFFGNSDFEWYLVGPLGFFFVSQKQNVLDGLYNKVFLKKFF